MGRAGIQDVVDCTLEMLTGNGDWKKVDNWILNLDGTVWSHLAEVGSGIFYLSKPLLSEVCVPPDLHKYTGTKGSIPKGGFSLADSYLNYPKGDNEI
jgi:hypothetical protein